MERNLRADQRTVVDLRGLFSVKVARALALSPVLVEPKLELP